MEEAITITHVKVASAFDAVNLEKTTNGIIDTQLDNGYRCVKTEYMTDAFGRMNVLLSFAKI